MDFARIVADIGVNKTFIASNAHVWFAYAVLYTLPHHWGFYALATALAGLKEYWFDATYEVPVQTFWDNTRDFAAYGLGIGLAYLAQRFLRRGLTTSPDMV